MKKLSNSQKRVFEFLRKSSARGISPSIREICDATGLSSTSSVHAIIKNLKEYGYINKTDGINRGITITGTENTTHVPIIGTVTAGAPIFAFEDIIGYVPFNISSEKELFALKVKGLSMKNAGILDGDCIVAEKTSSAKNGDIVVALIGDEATVKTFFNERGTIKLQAENPDFEDLYPTELTILGKVIAQMRYY